MVGSFAVLLLACIAAPVLAATTSGSSGGAAQTSTISGSPVGIADAQAVEGVRQPAPAEPAPEEAPPAVTPPKGGPESEVPFEPTEAEREEARGALDREAAAMTPEAKSERESSRFAYINLDPAQAEELLRQQFAPQLQAIDADPSRALGDVALERVVSPHEALVTVDGQTSLLESSIPLRAPEDDGELRKVDLGLEEGPAGFSPDNSLVDLTLPKTAGDPIAIGNSGLALTAQTEGDSAVRLFSDEDLYVPAVAEDTDVLLSPVTGGVEISTVVRSRNSPEQLAFSVSLPQGAVLRPSQDGGAEVIDPQKKEQPLLATISAPEAVDAQGTAIPVSLTVKEGSVMLEFPHRQLDVAYPIFVDPEVIEENWSGWWNPAALNYWGWEWGGVPSSETYIGQRSPIVSNWGTGLYIRSRSNTNYPGGSFGRWTYTPHGGSTYIKRAIFGPLNYNWYTCGNKAEPHAYAGVWGTNEAWTFVLGSRPNASFGWIDTAPWGDLPPWSKKAMVGISSDFQQNITCGRDYGVGGASMFLDDGENPSLGTVTGYPTGWTNSESPFILNAPVVDGGLGVYSATYSPEGAPPQTKTLACNGHVTSQCPGGYTFQWEVSAKSFDQGEKKVQVSGTDVLKKSTSTFPFWLKIDRSAPVIDLDGQLAEATEEEGTKEPSPAETEVEALPLPVYRLDINATDGNAKGEAKDKRSGVKSIQIFLDDEKSPREAWSKSSCPETSCSLAPTYTLKLNEIAAIEKHTLRIVATDFANNPNERKIEFRYIPATGMKDEYVLQKIPLTENGEGDDEGLAKPELAVNVVNGNLVYRQRDAEIEGPMVDLEVERFYNSLLPESQDTEWGEGWTLAQTPTLETESSGEATLVEESGAVESQVELPDQIGKQRFDEQLQAVIAKETTGYQVTDESGGGEGTVVFNEAGEATEYEASEYAGVEFDYGNEEGALSEITVDDGASTGFDTEAAAEREALENMTPVFKTSFGTQGTGNGQFKVINDVAIDPTDGTVWVSDDDNNRVQHFGAGGDYLGKFSVCEDPASVLVEGAGNLYVACGTGLKKYSDTGTLLKTIATRGYSPGQVSFVTDMALDSDEELWVASAESGEVKHFDAAGNYVGAFSTGTTLQRPWGIAVSPNGEIWVTQPYYEHRVVVFDEEGEVQRTFGTQGSSDGQFNFPSDVEVDSHGNVWVGDARNDRVQVFNEGGEYITEFGQSGAGPGQLDGDWWLRLDVDDQGTVYLTDQANSRVQRWKEGNYFGSFEAAAGTSGAALGQFKVINDIAIDPTDGSAWVSDDENNRVQHLDAAGDPIGQFPVCEDPASVLVEGAGNLYVACGTGLKKYSDTGTLLKTIATRGYSPGQVSFVTDMALDSDEELWVASAESGEVKHFDAAGNYVGAFSTGTTLQRPWGIAVSPNGEIWVTQPYYEHRVAIFDTAGKLLRTVGGPGSGEGQFNFPSDVEFDSHGFAWVADARNYRVQIFNQAGKYVTEFGSKGTGPGQFEGEWWLRLDVDNGGTAWLTDQGNHRVQRWKAPGRTLVDYGTTMQDDPSVDVAVDDGLVESVAGEEVGEISYEHDDAQLTAVEGPEGETTYDYDGNDHMTKVTLPNGTYAEIAYEATYGRVKSVTVWIEGAGSKTTYFNYEDQPQQRTTVTLPAPDPVTTYEIAPDGSVVQWWDAVEPPEIKLAGTLADVEGRETEAPIASGPHNLEVEAHSEHGIALIQIIANNNVVVSEKTCAQILGPPVECRDEIDEWATETGNWPPGIVYLEAVVTDAGGRMASERFWVNIPYTPPPSGEEPVPLFDDILRFREEFGLDLDIKGDESAIYDRIYDLMGAWHNPHTPSGEVARASTLRWGVPLRPIDVAEMEYREWFIEEDGPRIQKWGEDNYPSTYAGYWVDHQNGGIIRVGFVGDQATPLGQLKAAPGIVAAERFAQFGTPPTRAISELVSLQMAVAVEHASEPPLEGLITGIRIDVAQNRVSVGATDVSAVSGALSSAYGAAPFDVEYRPAPESQAGDRTHKDGPVVGGQIIAESIVEEGEKRWITCTAGFGARKNLGRKPNGEIKWAEFSLTAGHCFQEGQPIYRGTALNKAENIYVGPYVKFGEQGSRKWKIHEDGKHFEVDIAAVKLTSPGVLSGDVYNDSGAEIGIEGVDAAEIGMTLCLSAGRSNTTRCQAIYHPAEINIGDGTPYSGPFWQIPTFHKTEPGDSGAPLYSARERKAIAIHVWGPGPSLHTPLLAPPLPEKGPYPFWKVERSTAEGALKEPWMEGIQIMKGK